MLLIFFLAACCSLLAYAGTALVLRGNTNAPNGFLQALAETKLDAASRIPAPRLLVMSGSGGLFGIRASVLEERTGMPVVNVGLHGGLGAAYLLYFGEQVAREGDVALIALESPLFQSEHMVTQDAVYLSWALGDAYFGSLPFEQSIAYFRMLSWQSVLAMLESYFHPPERRAGPWRVEMITEAGDLLSGPSTQRSRRDYAQNYEMNVQNFQAMARVHGLEYDKPIPMAISNSIARMRKRGVRVIATWANLSSDKLYDDFYGKVRSRLPDFYRHAGAGFIHTASESRLDADLMFDTAFHPNSAGALKRSRELADAICRQTDICKRRTRP